MVSYLLVVGLVFLPTVIYLRTVQQRELHESIQRDLEAELQLLGKRLSGTPTNQMQDVVALILDLVPQRVTVVDAEGRVIGDNSEPLKRFEHKGDRPEIRQALETGRGAAVRYSETTLETMIFAALRFPASGEPRGVVRLAVPSRAVDDAGSRSYWFFNRTGAVALSAAVLLSLLASLVVSRPLTRIADSARAFAAGDFGHPVGVDSRDELGDAAQALEELAAQLKGRLLASGADRAALHALLDDLPVGVILYDPAGTPTVINGRARELCDLTPSGELEQARRIPSLPGQEEVIARVLETMTTSECAVQLPWAPSRRLRGRWIALFARDGTQQAGLVLLEQPEDGERRQSLERLLFDAAEDLRVASTIAGDPDLAARLARRARELERWTAPSPVEHGSVTTTTVRALWLAVEKEVAPTAGPRQVKIASELEDEQLVLAEADDRVRRALRRLLEEAIWRAPAGGTVRLYGEQEGTRYLLSVPVSVIGAPLEELDALVAPLGGRAESRRANEGSETRLLLARA